MNFKPTLLKSIVSLISGVITNYLLVGMVQVQCLLDSNPSATTCFQPPWLKFAFDPVPIIISLSMIVIVYFIWSFVQK